jgi:menaquinone-dependent protoporphyrinogen oxidase
VPSVLVVYATSSGATRTIAQRVAQTLDSLGMNATLVNVREAPPAVGFDAVIVGSGIRVAHWHASARHWLKANSSAIRAVPHALFSVGLSAVDPSRQDEAVGYLATLVADHHLSPVSVAAFPGWYLPERFSLMERGILRIIHAPKGDFRDFAAVTEWTSSVAATLAQSQPDLI